MPVRFSTPLRDVLDRLYLEQSRDNLQLISKILRENFGQDLLAKIITGDIEKIKNDLLVVDGIRRPDDIKYLRHLKNFLLVAVDTDIKIRFKRVRSRTQNTDDQGKSWEEFLEEEKGETELYIPELIKQADITINNNGQREEMFQQLDNLMKEING